MNNPNVYHDPRLTNQVNSLNYNQPSNINNYPQQTYHYNGQTAGYPNQNHISTAPTYPPSSYHVNQNQYNVNPGQQTHSQAIYSPSAHNVTPGFPYLQTVSHSQHVNNPSYIPHTNQSYQINHNNNVNINPHSIQHSLPIANNLNQHKEQHIEITLWQPSPVDKLRLDTWFNDLDENHMGKIGGIKVVNFLKSSNLSKDSLRIIWSLVDYSNSGYVDLNQFYNIIRMIAISKSPIYAGSTPTVDRFNKTIHDHFPIPTFDQPNIRNVDIHLSAPVVNEEEFSDFSEAPVHETVSISHNQHLENLNPGFSNNIHTITSPVISQSIISSHSLQSNQLPSPFSNGNNSHLVFPDININSGVLQSRVDISTNVVNIVTNNEIDDDFDTGEFISATDIKDSNNSVNTHTTNNIDQTNVHTNSITTNTSISHLDNNKPNSNNNNLSSQLNSDDLLGPVVTYESVKGQVNDRMSYLDNIIEMDMKAANEEWDDFEEADESVIQLTNQSVDAIDTLSENHLDNTLPDNIVNSFTYEFSQSDDRIVDNGFHINSNETIEDFTTKNVLTAVPSNVIAEIDLSENKVEPVIDDFLVFDNIESSNAITQSHDNTLSSEEDFGDFIETATNHIESFDETTSPSKEIMSANHVDVLDDFGDFSETSPNQFDAFDVNISNEATNSASVVDEFGEFNDQPTIKSEESLDIKVDSTINNAVIEVESSHVDSLTNNKSKDFDSIFGDLLDIESSAVDNSNSLMMDITSMNSNAIKPKIENHQINILDVFDQYAPVIVNNKTSNQNADFNSFDADFGDFQDVNQSDPIISFETATHKPIFTSSNELLDVYENQLDQSDLQIVYPQIFQSEYEELAFQLIRLNYYNEAIACLSQHDIQQSIKKLSFEKTLAVENDELEMAIEIKNKLKQLNKQVFSNDVIAIYRQIVIDSKTSKSNSQLINELIQLFKSLNINDSVELFQRSLIDNYTLKSNGNIPLKLQLETVLSHRKQLDRLLHIFKSKTHLFGYWSKLLDHLVIELSESLSVISTYQSISLQEKQQIVCHKKFHDFLISLLKLIEAGSWICLCCERFNIFKKQSTEVTSIFNKLYDIIINEKLFGDLIEHNKIVKPVIDGSDQSSTCQLTYLPVDSTVQTVQINGLLFVKSVYNVWRHVYPKESVAQL